MKTAMPTVSATQKDAMSASAPRQRRRLDQRAVSDVLGSILMIGITVMMATAFGAVLFAFKGPTDSPQSNLAITVDPGNAAWGNGDALTTFNLPDMRGRFLRGTDHGLGSDPDAASRVASAGGGNTGDSVGTYQGHQFERHAHGYSGAFTQDSGVVGGHLQGGSATSFTVWGYSNNTSQAGGNETRPVNVSVNYIIKY